MAKRPTSIGAKASRGLRTKRAAAKPKRPPSNPKRVPKKTSARSVDGREYALGCAMSDKSNWGPIAMKAFVERRAGTSEFTLSIAGDGMGGGGALEKGQTAMNIVSDTLLDHIAQSDDAGEKIKWSLVVAPISALEYSGTDENEDEDDGGLSLEQTDVAVLRRRAGAKSKKVVVGA